MPDRHKNNNKRKTRLRLAVGAFTLPSAQKKADAKNAPYVFLCK